MGADIGVLAAEAQEDQEQDAGRQRRPAPDAAAPRHHPALPQEARDDAQGTEQRRGRADRRVAGRLQRGRERVAEGARQQDREPAEAGAQELGHEQAEHQAGGEIAHKMAVVDMQRQGGDGAPPGPALDQARLGSTQGRPVGPPVALLQAEEEQQDRSEGHGGTEPAMADDHGRAHRQHHGALTLVGLELVEGPRRVGRVDIEGDAAAVGREAAADPGRRQHQGQLLRVAPAPAAAQQDGLVGTHDQHATASAARPALHADPLPALAGLVLGARLAHARALATPPACRTPTRRRCPRSSRWGGRRRGSPWYGRRPWRGGTRPRARRCASHGYADRTHGFGVLGEIDPDQLALDAACRRAGC